MAPLSSKGNLEPEGMLLVPDSVPFFVDKDLSDEVERLKACANAQVGSDTYDGILVKMTRKRSRDSGTVREVLVSPSASDGLEHASVIGSANHSSKETIAGGALLDDHEAKCSGRKTDGDGEGTDVAGPSNCVFKDLVECLLGMQLSSVSQADGASISAIHQPSGYTFSLTQINNSCEEEPKILYRVLSLGTFERVAPEWMKEEVLMFSKKMCPIFFERVSRAIKLHR